MSSGETVPVWTIAVTGDMAEFNGELIAPKGSETPTEAVIAVAVAEVRRQFGRNCPVRVRAEADGRTYWLAISGSGRVEEIEAPVEDGAASEEPPSLPAHDVEAAGWEVPEEPEPVAHTDDVAEVLEVFEAQSSVPLEASADPRDEPVRPGPVEVDPDVWQHLEFAPESRQQARARRQIPQPQLRATPSGLDSVKALFGIKPEPSAADRARYEAEMVEYRARLAAFDDEIAVSHRFVGPRVVAVANGKGGAGKTPFSLMLAAVFGLHGAQTAYVDNNETRGTGGDRTAQARHRATVKDLLCDYEHLTSATATAADLAKFSHHQASDKYDVYNSVPDEFDTAKQLDGQQFAQVAEVLTRFYHYLIVDSGNNQSASNWLAMADAADVIVIPLAPKDDHVKNAKRLLRDLATKHGQHGRELARRAVIVVTQGSPAQDVTRAAEDFANLARHVVTIAYDPALEADWLRYDALDERTQRSLLELGAAVVESITAGDEAQGRS